MRTVFNIDYKTVWGEQLCVVGSAEALGGGNEAYALPMNYLGDGRWIADVILPDDVEVSYSYIVKSDWATRREWGVARKVMTSKTTSVCRLYDAWSDMPADSSFYSSAFTDGIFSRGKKRQKGVVATKDSLILSVSGASVRPSQVLAVVGEGDALGNWDPAKAVVMSDADYPEWKVALKLAKVALPFEYKFVILDAKSHDVVAWEGGENHRCEIMRPEKGGAAVVSGMRFYNPQPAWRGAGVAIPVFALRSQKSFGVGEFNDLKLMVDWAVQTGQKMIQILPINDTTMTGTWQDSYPYNANSTFALHPQFIHLPMVGKLSKSSQTKYNKLAKELNALAEIDYERVNNAKREFLHELFESEGEKTFASDDYKCFFERNRKWLVPYAAFCALRDRFSTPEFQKWGEYALYDAAKIEAYSSKKSKTYKDVAFNYFVQYHLHLQISDVRNYAHSKGVVLKGDIPIGISRTSADAWVDPDLFNMNSQAGAPPDDFSVLGQNWGFPTYNWAKMAEDGYAWWKARFAKMAEYFDAYRIDHILGFFRIWEIPCNAVHGLLGHFNPALPYTCDELRDYGFWFNYDRHAQPYIYEYMLGDFFGEWTDDVKRDYLYISDYGRCSLREEVSTQEKIAALFAGKSDDRSLRLRDGLMGLLDEVLFVEDPVKIGCFHPRISAQFTYSYKALSEGERNSFDRLYNDFYYHRHDEFWREEAMKKLPPLISATRMLVCGEDLGMIPHCVPAVMDSQQILSLEIQRMPKDPKREFGDTWSYPYLSVCTTSTHDMTPIRAWWEEDREKTQHFYNSMLHAGGGAPFYCEPWVCERILDMHVKSPAMLTVLPLQDWLSMDGTLRRENPNEERINIPANSRHYWRYRMHMTLEQLNKESAFNERLRQMIADGGR